MTKLGDLLKSEREKRNLSLHEIGMSLKINPKILKAIEDGDQANFPAKTFLRGFVKSYAQYLRLDVDQTLQMFQDEYGGNRASQPAPESQAPQHVQGVPKYESSLKRPEDSALPVSNNNRIYTILFAILLLTLIAFVAKMMDKYQKESRDAKPAVVDTNESTTTTTSMPETTSTTVPGESTESTTTTTVPVSAAVTTTLPSVTSTTTTLKASPVVAPAVTTTTVRPVATTTTVRPGVTTTTLTVRPAATVSTTTTTVTSSTSTTLKPTTTEVIVEALNRVTIRFTLNEGQKWETLELNPDQVHTFRSRTSIQLEATDGGAINIIVNGRDRGVPGTIGKPLRLKFP